MRNGKEGNPTLKYFKVWGCLAKVQVPIPKRIKIGHKIVNCNIRLEYSSERSKRPWKEQKENVLNKEIPRCSKCQRTSTFFKYDFVTFLVSSVDSSFWTYGVNSEIGSILSNPIGSWLIFPQEINFWVQSESSKGK